MKDSVDRKYVIVLGAVALLILVGGAFLRPKKAAPQPPSPSESAALQSRIQRDDLAETASYLAQRAQVFAQHVLYDPMGPWSLRRRLPPPLPELIPLTRRSRATAHFLRGGQFYGAVADLSGKWREPSWHRPGRDPSE